MPEKGNDMGSDIGSDIDARLTKAHKRGTGRHAYVSDARLSRRPTLSELGQRASTSGSSVAVLRCRPVRLAVVPDACVTLLRLSPLHSPQSSFGITGTSPACCKPPPGLAGHPLRHAGRHRVALNRTE